MRIRLPSLVLVLGVLVAVGLTGCSSSARSALAEGPYDTAMLPKPIAAPGLAVDMVKTEGGVAELPCAPAPRRVYYSQDPCCPTVTCGLPCETGCGNWHVRGVVGFPFFSADESSIDGCYYFGADVGRTFPCCWGVDLFVRAFGGEADRNVALRGAPTYAGSDVGDWFTLGVKATYQRSINNGKLFWYAGIGPEVFWTRNFVVEEEGFGVFGEIGLGYVLSSHWRIRGGLDVHALSTKAAAENAADDGSRHLLWVFAPVVGVGFTF